MTKKDLLYLFWIFIRCGFLIYLSCVFLELGVLIPAIFIFILIFIDLGIDYKQKYEELVELLKPYKIDEDMSPATTLKMILKYHK